MNNTCLQLKGSVVTTFILELYHYSSDIFSRQLSEKINQAPEFFARSPVVISLEKFEHDVNDIDLLEMLAICRQFNLQPMAFKSSRPDFVAAIQQTGLAHLSASAMRSESIVAPVADTPEKIPAEIDSTQDAQSLKPVLPKSKIITRPVRSGQQVYAEGGDLIILSQVSEGAEVLADGHIHVYGRLRGRALAGVKGDETARVFCNSLEAELISIAGNFMLSDALREKTWKHAAQVYLDAKTLHVEAV